MKSTEDLIGENFNYRILDLIRDYMVKEIRATTEKKEIYEKSKRIDVEIKFFDENAHNFYQIKLINPKG